MQAVVPSKLVAVALLSVLATGCIPTLPLRHLSTYESQPIALLGFQEEAEPTQGAAATATEAPMLGELLQIASTHHPDLQAAQARVEAARGRMIQAGLYPNPSIGPNFGQLGDSANRMGEAGARFTQTFVTAHKLRIARSAAAHGVEAADFAAITKLYEVVTRVRFAYFELLTALREQDTTLVIVGVSEKALQTAVTLEKAGAGNRPDVLRATVELEQNRLKREVTARRVEAAWQSLYTAVGRPPMSLDRFTPNRKELEQTPPEYDWKAMLECLRDSSSELQEARAVISQQEKLVAKAKADVVPNFTVSAIPFYESSAREMRAEIIVQAPLPIFDRNQGNILTARSDLTRSWADERALTLRLTERLTLAFQRYQAARQQVDAYNRTIVPQAEESLRLIETGYKGGDKKYDYTAVLQAQQVLFQAQLSQTQAMGEQWRAVVELAGILQQENLHHGAAIIERR